jgi:MoaA/NifB/PqqE/SkfB family radical SAM enzyme
MWFSPVSTFVVAGDATELRVNGPGCVARLTGNLAEEFLRAFLSEEGARADRIESLAAMGSEAHAALARAGRQGGGRPWVPLSAASDTSTLFLEVVGRCNERCVHCYAGSAPDVAEALDADTCLRVIRQAAELGFDRLQLTGGDPLLCPFLPDLAREGRAAGFEFVEVYTNGLALSPDRLDALAAHDVSFAFSFYSHEPAVHDAITRTPGSHQRTRDAITRAARRGLDVRVGVVLLDANADHFEATRAMLVEAGVPPERIGADRVRTVGRGLLALGTAPVALPRDVHVGHAGDAVAPASLRSPGKLCVSNTGAVYPCIFTRWARLGDVATESLGAIVDRVRRARSTGVDVDRFTDRLACMDCRLTALAIDRTETVTA